jgi:hypothetical protein
MVNKVAPTRCLYGFVIMPKYTAYQINSISPRADDYFGDYFLICISMYTLEMSIRELYPTV